jgi:hypothetical protein
MVVKRRLALIAGLVFLISSVLPLTATSVRADEQWFDSWYLGKTYLNNYGWHEVYFDLNEWCGGGVWGGTYNFDYPAQKVADLWSQQWLLAPDPPWYTWHNGADGESWAEGWDAAQTVVYNGNCTRGATDHYAIGAYRGTTSDGF